MTDDQFIETSKQLALAVLTLCERKGISGEDTAHLAGAALGEVLAQHLGPFGAVERLRGIADTFEAQCLGNMPPLN